MSSKETAAKGDLQPLPEVTMGAMLSHSCGRGEGEQKMGNASRQGPVLPTQAVHATLPDTGPPCLPCFPLVRAWSLSSLVLVNGPFHTKNSTSTPFKTFYSIIYTFKIIICNCPSCHTHCPHPICGVCGQLILPWDLLEQQAAMGRAKGTGSNSNQQPFLHTLHISHAFWVGRKSTGSQRHVNLLHSEVRSDLRWWAALQVV